MGQNWILSVLADLESFADLNGLPLVADRMREAGVVAAAEIAATPGKAADQTHVDPGTTWTLPRNA